MPGPDAFNKGVEYFVEIFIFYGLLGGLAIYEMKKGIESGKQ